MGSSPKISYKYHMFIIPEREKEAIIIAMRVFKNGN